MDLRIHHPVVSQDPDKVGNRQVEAQVVLELDLTPVEDLMENLMDQDLDQIQEVDLTGVQAGQAAEEDQMALDLEVKVELQIQKNPMNLHQNKLSREEEMGVQQTRFQTQQRHLAQMVVVGEDQKLE
jgi:hypothetical protein